MANYFSISFEVCFDFFIDYVLYKVVIKYLLHSLCFTLHPCNFFLSFFFSLCASGLVFVFFLFFFGHTYDMWKFPGQGLNPCHHSDQSHSRTMQDP